jgi:predicted SAM-dependent methyltransferase
MIKINLGCGWRNFGKDWLHVDNGDYQHLDLKHDISKKLPFPENFADVIYSSHVIEYFDRNEIKAILTDWKRVLKPGCTIRLAVPDFEAIANLYTKGSIKIEQILGPIYGEMKMGESVIYHKTAYDFKSIKLLLEECGFINVKRYDWRKTDHANFDDHSQAYLPHMDKENGDLISLNIEAINIK